MTWDDVGEYLVDAITNLYGKDRVMYAEDLDLCLNVTWYKNMWHIPSMPVDDPEEIKKAATLYKQLVGPHGKTLLRAYQIKHGLPIREIKTNEGI